MARLKEPKKNYCINCEEIVQFSRNKCEGCGGIYEDVVPASYKSYKLYFGLKKI